MGTGSLTLACLLLGLGAAPDEVFAIKDRNFNIPIKIGEAVVLPGDVVLGDSEGVIFIPPHLVQEIVDEAEITHVHDEWTKKKFDEGKYKSTEIYGRPTDPALIKEYEDYLKQKVGPEAYEKYTKRMQQFRQQGPQRKQQQ